MCVESQLWSVRCQLSVLDFKCLISVPVVCLGYFGCMLLATRGGAVLLPQNLEKKPLLAWGLKILGS